MIDTSKIALFTLPVFVFLAIYRFRSVILSFLRKWWKSERNIQEEVS
jgi:hypothetical protein